MPTYKRNCIICGAEFETSRPQQFRCPVCANLKRAVCAVCGKEFVTDRRNNVKTAILHGITPATARQKALRGGFATAVKVGRDWLIDEDEPKVDLRIAQHRRTVK